MFVMAPIPFPQIEEKRFISPEISIEKNIKKEKKKKEKDSLSLDVCYWHRNLQNLHLINLVEYVNKLQIQSEDLWFSFLKIFTFPTHKTNRILVLLSHMNRSRYTRINSRHIHEQILILVIWIRVSLRHIKLDCESSPILWFRLNQSLLWMSKCSYHLFIFIICESNSN